MSAYPGGGAAEQASTPDPRDYFISEVQTWPAWGAEAGVGAPRSGMGQITPDGLMPGREGALYVPSSMGESERGSRLRTSAPTQLSRWLLGLPGRGRCLKAPLPRQAAVACGPVAVHLSPWRLPARGSSPPPTWTGRTYSSTSAVAPGH